MSPTPGRSTLITSAPNQASNCVQVGPDWTWVKSRMRTPFSAFVIVVCSVVSALHRQQGKGKGPVATPVANLFLFQLALRVEVADATALAAGRRVEHGIDEGRLAGVPGRGNGALELVRRRRIDADATEGFHHLVVARAFDKHGWRDVRTTAGIDIG